MLGVVNWRAASPNILWVAIWAGQCAYASSGFRLKCLAAITVKTVMASAPAMPTANADNDDDADDVEGDKNCTVTCEPPFTRFVSKFVVYHT